MEIVAHNLSVGHGSNPVLSGINLTLRPGELVGLLGPNGAGKTTLLRVLAGLAAPLSGTVTYDGHYASRLAPRVLARRIAYLAQGGEVNAALSSRAVVTLGRLPYRSALAGPSAADRDAVTRAFDHADANDLADRPIATLSGGERARVLLARALAVEGEMLLADEPVAALDPYHQLRTLELLRDAARRGMGVVVVLHDLAQAARYCDRVILIANGGVLADGSPAVVLTDAALAAVYRIVVARSQYDGEPLLVPWRHLDQR